MRARAALVALLAAAAPAVAPTVASGQPQPQATPRAGYQLAGKAYAGVPFAINVIVEGLAADPAPQPPSITIPGATVSSLGVDYQEPPTFIVNGQRIDQGPGKWILRYRVEVAKGGAYNLPPLTVVQGSTQVKVPGARLPVAELQTTRDMAIEVALPGRPVYVGETVPAEIHWFLRTNPQEPTLSVPLLAMEDALTVAVPPPRNPREVLAFAAGGRDLQLGFTQDSATRDGVEYTRLTFPILITPRRPGALALPPAQVVAQLPTGRMVRDRYGFPTEGVELFRASDEARTLDVRALPETGKPASFGGAVGGSFSIATRTSRSVVQLGEPVELEIAVKSDQRLDAIGLPPLDGPGMLPKAQFTVPAEPPVGELSPDGLTKTFRVPVQVIGADATAIPALAFSYFDPVRATYQTIHSEPIALQVAGGSVVGAAQVVGGGAATGGGGGAVAEPATGTTSLAGVELALSPSGGEGAPLSRSVLWLLVGLLYAVPLGLFAVRTWRLRTAGRREQAGEAKIALRALRDEIARAQKIPARDAAVALPRAMRDCARAVGVSVDEKLIERIENAGFAPGAGGDPLPSELRGEASDLADSWARAPQRPRAGDGAAAKGGATGAALLLALATLAAPSVARADETVRAGRADYQAALDASDPQIRQRNFAAAAAAFSRAARTSRSAALHTDWGNAALGAGDVGGAALAYRRALLLDRTDDRARKNLSWLRSRMPQGMRPASGGATQTLFFFHSNWTREQRLVVGAFAFAAMMLMLVPWGGTRRRGVMAGALVPGLIWLAMTISVLIESRDTDDAVVMQAAILRVADHPSAAPKLASPLPAGVEVTILERRASWNRIRLPSGEVGWLPSASLERVTP